MPLATVSAVYQHSTAWHPSDGAFAGNARFTPVGSGGYLRREAAIVMYAVLAASLLPNQQNSENYFTWFEPNVSLARQSY
jgi:hypothetical protein